ncbi:unnamed protein product [Cunninghamella blakesleeana]
MKVAEYQYSINPTGTEIFQGIFRDTVTKELILSIVYKYQNTAGSSFVGLTTSQWKDFKTKFKYLQKRVNQQNLPIPSVKGAHPTTCSDCNNSKIIFWLDFSLMNPNTYAINVSQTIPGHNVNITRRRPLLKQYVILNVTIFA